VGVRVLLVHHGYPPASTGGSEVYTRALARRLSRDHEVAVLHRSADPGRPDHEVTEGRVDGIRVLSLNNLRREVSGFESYRDARAAATVAAAILVPLRPEVVHVGHLTGLSTGIVFEARRRGAAVALTLHDFWTVCPLGQLLNRRLEVCPGPEPRRCLGCVGSQVAMATPTARALGRRLPLAGAAGALLSRVRPSSAGRIAERLAEMHEVLRAADVLLSPSRFLRDRLRALGAPPIEYLPNGHEPLVPHPRRPDPAGRVRIGFVGAAIPSKGVHVLARAFRSLGDSSAALRIHGPFPPYHGDSGYEGEVRRLLGERAGDSLKGPFPHEELPRILSEIDVLVVPSLWEENAPLTVEEAFQARIPVVVSGHGGLAERVRDGEGGLRFRPGDAADLARILRRLVASPEERARLAERAPAVYSMEDHAAALERLYDGALHRRAERTGRVGVVVLDQARPADATAAARSAAGDGIPTEVLIVENGGEPFRPPGGVGLLRLEQNVGFGAGMNAGIRYVRERGCDRILLLNNDALLEEGALRRLAEALEDGSLAAVGPVILRSSDGRIESRGGRLDLRWGRHRLQDHGAAFSPREGRLPVETLSGAALMVSVAALDRVGMLDEPYFLGFEDTEWCVRARRAGLGLAVVLGAVARHHGGRTLGPTSPLRLYYAARNHLRALERLDPASGPRGWLRTGAVIAMNLAHALRQSTVPRGEAVRAVWRGVADHHRGISGPSGDGNP
jgi:glycosyltransferase involved in cell wall biosynthesis/GT2 family glycosyltransferase